jgi:hypothetical protein
LADLFAISANMNRHAKRPHRSRSLSRVARLRRENNCFTSANLWENRANVIDNAGGAILVH